MASGALKAITNCGIITPGEIIPDGVLLIDRGQVLSFGPSRTMTVPDDCEIIDAGGNYLGPGFIDIHCHGGGGVWWYEDPKRYMDAHLRHGTTGILATSGMYKDLDDLCRGIDRIAGEMESGRCPAILGIHMEGPYKNPKYGAQPKLSIEIKKEEYQRLLRHGKDVIKIWTIAPELPGIDDFIRAVRPFGHVLSVGHSEAAPEEILRHISDKLILACHALDATGTSPSLKGEAGTRNVSVDDVVLLEDRIYAEVIPDAEGVHVRPLLLKLLLKTKGAERIVIITDGTKDSGAAPSGISDDLRVDLNFNENGLCGSRLTMDRAARNMMVHTGASLPQIFTMASLNPAKVLGLEHAIGSIEPRKIANLVLVDQELNLKKVFFMGEELFPLPGSQG